MIVVCAPPVHITEKIGSEIKPWREGLFCVLQYGTQNKKTSIKKARLGIYTDLRNSGVNTYYAEVSVGRTHSRVNQSSLDQISCFLSGTLSCTVCGV